MLAGVVVSVLILVYPVLIILLVMNVMLMQLGMFAVMWTFGFTYNVSSMVQLFMATGLAVDYTLFVLYRYVTVPLKSRRGRAMAAFTESGPGLTVGGVSLILFALPLCFSECFVLRQLGVLLCFAVLLGLALSLLVIPTLLSYLGPTSVLDIEGSSDNPHLKDYSEFMQTHHDHLVDQLERSAKSASGSLGGDSNAAKSISNMIAPNVSFRMASFRREKSQGSITGSRSNSRVGSRAGSMAGSVNGASSSMKAIEESSRDQPTVSLKIRAPSIRWAELREGSTARPNPVNDLENPLSADSPLNTPRENA